MKIKFLSIQLLLVLGSISYAQVGIGTTEPKRTLHVEGNLQVRDSKDKLGDKKYTKVIVVNKEGDFDYSTIDQLLPPVVPGNDTKKAINNHYITANKLPNNTNTVVCGKFEFAYITKGSQGNVRFRLKEAPIEDIKIYTTFEQNFNGNGFEFEAKSSPRTLTPANEFIDLPATSSEARIVSGEYNELYISYPKDPEFYRVSFYVIDENETRRHWVTTCENF